MTAIRTSVKIVLTTIASALLLLIPTQGAWAVLPAPGGSSSTPVTPASTVSASAGLTNWEVASIGAAIVVATMLLVVLAARIVRAHHASPRRAVAA